MSELISIMPEFPCSKCGACCRRAHVIPNFPEPLNEDGSCVHLQKDHSCGIYSTRPEICRINDYYKQKFKDEMSIEIYHQETAKFCNKLITDDYGENSLYLIPIQPQKPLT